MYHSKKEKPFDCTYPGCCKSFARKDCQQLHIKTHTGEKSYVCDTWIKSCNCEENCSHVADTLCGKSFITSSHLNRHKKTHRDLFVHVCDMAPCAAKYKKKSQLRQHKLDAHNLAEFLCEEEGCARHFVSKAKLLIHQQTRHGGFMCPVVSCSALFPSNDLLVTHLAAHDTNVTLFKKRPRKKLKASLDLKLQQHQPRHEFEYQYGEAGGTGAGAEEGGMCYSDFDLDDEIGMLYAGGSYVDEDEDEDEGGDDDYALPPGGGGTDQRQEEEEEEEDNDNDDDVYFIGHIREGGSRRKRGRSLSVSSDKAPAAPRAPPEKTFRCSHPDCTRSFNQKKNLEAHIKALHSAERPYPCPEPFCGQAFGFKSVLERHLLRCHGRMDLIGQQPPSVPSAAIARAIQVQVTGPATAGCVLAAASSSASTDRVDPDREDTDSTDGVQSCSSVNKPVSGGRSTAAAASREDSEQDGQYQWNNILGVNFSNSTTV